MSVQHSSVTARLIVLSMRRVKEVRMQRGLRFSLTEIQLILELNK